MSLFRRRVTGRRTNDIVPARRDPDRRKHYTNVTPDQFGQADGGSALAGFVNRSKFRNVLEKVSMKHHRIGGDVFVRINNYWWQAVQCPKCPRLKSALRIFRISSQSEQCVYAYDDRYCSYQRSESRNASYEGVCIGIDYVFVHVASNVSTGGGSGNDFIAIRRIQYQRKLWKSLDNRNCE